MTPEMIAILAVGVALAGLMLSSQRDSRRAADKNEAAIADLRRDLTGRMDRIDARLDALDARLRMVEAGQAELRGRFDGIGGRFDGIEGRFDGVEGRFDGIEGQLAFLRDYITGRNTRSVEQPAAPAE